MPFKTTNAALCFLFSLSATAGTIGTVHSEKHLWSMVGSLGYTGYNAAYSGGSANAPTAQAAIGDGQTAFGRFAIAREFGVFSRVHWGAEVGVQNGKTFRLDVPQLVIDPLGGILPEAQIEPMLDLLATASYQPANSPAFGLVKLGVAYRRLQINDRVTFNDLSQAAFELQAGIGIQISDRANLSLNYQGVFNGSTTYTIDLPQETGNISNIPNQNGLLLSLSYNV